MRPGRRNLITDVAGLVVGQAQDDRIKSGVTVVTGARPFTAAVHVMGGAPGTRETDLLAPDKLVQEVDALVLSGGSAFGLDAASGVADALVAAGRGFAVGAARVPIVPAAILFDLLNGGDKDWGTNPYAVLGRAAYDVCGPDFALGSAGAGTGATAGPLKGGIGSASLVLDNGLTVGAIVAVNSLGSVTDEAGTFWAAPWEMSDEFGGRGPERAFDPGLEPDLPGLPGQNTTIAIIGTDAALTQAQATRMAVAAHDGMARAIQPSHTPFDGDLVFAAATGQNPLPDSAADPMRLGHAAAVALSRAIARGVYAASPAPNDKEPTWTTKFL